jgi:hypothetical protein
MKGRLALEVLATYVRARVLLRRHGLPATLRALRDVPPADPAARPARLGVKRLARVVTREVGRLPDGKCLLRSIVLVALLARRGTASTLVLGVRPGEAFAAHAWVEVDGEAVLPTEDRFLRLTEL